jgi:hypothetical protein
MALVFGWSGCGDSGEPDVQPPTPAEERAALRAEAQVQREEREQRQVEGEIRAGEQQRRKEASRSQPDSRSEPESTSGGFTGPQAKRYEEDREICGLFPPSKVARDLGLSASSDSVTIAEAYADGYQPQFHQAAFEGCLDGLGS